MPAVAVVRFAKSAHSNHLLTVDVVCRGERRLASVASLAGAERAALAPPARSRWTPEAPATNG